MRNIRYIGNSAVNKAFYLQTGIIWTPGKVDTVLDDKTAAEMLMYTDVFEDAGDSFAVNSGAMSLDPTAGLLLGGAAPTEQQRAAVLAGIDGQKAMLRLGRAAIAAELRNPSEEEVSSAVTVTGGAFTAHLATTVALGTNTTLFRTGGGVPATAPDAATYSLKSVSGATNIGVTGAISTADYVEFFTTANQVLFRFFVSSGLTNARFRVSIDGKYTTKASRQLVPFTGAATGAAQFVLLDFTSHGGGGIKRRIRFERCGDINFGTISYDAGTIWAPSDSPPQVCFVGDSYFAWGAGNTSPSSPLDSVAYLAANKLGCSPTIAAIGGTGYTNNATTMYKYADPQRLADLSLRAFDAYVVSGGLNDAAGSAATITAEATKIIEEIRRVRPYAPVFFTGVFQSAAVLSPLTVTEIENAVKQAVTNTTHDGIYFIPVVTDVLGPWITAGNYAAFIHSDNSHAKPVVGEEYLAGRLAEAIKSVLLD